MRRVLLALALLALPTTVHAQQAPVTSSPAVIQTPVSIANGGTGQATNTLAFNALAPCSVQGDVLFYNGTNWVCLATGTAGSPLITNGAAANPSFGVFRFPYLLTSTTVTMSGTTHQYIGGFHGAAAGTGVQIAAARPCVVASTLVRIDLGWDLITAGSAETTSLLLVKNGSTASTLDAAKTWNQTALARQNTAYTGLSVSCTAGDDFEIDLNGGGTNFATDPVGIFQATLEFTIP